MTFEDLPHDLRDLSLDDPDLRADVVDLFVGYFDRLDGCFAIVLLDDAHRIVQPVLITEMGEADPPALAIPVRALLTEARPQAIIGALGRTGSPLFTDTDRACHQVLVDLCRDLEIELLGAYVATDNLVRELPDHLRMAS
ncbi:hypothetical protein JNB_02875 [Janibacter sp. HTCC2649]|uniref:hypothetical protein n=1 Tax=Janibacter sp. HTCC2649 TaxID=313589 RepID=UPI000066E9F7|nr:hypothetical protein [Janibacter sp. HTCC2649]EAP99077.1 hypothetical protein JNB_02875 [Janibacter sp. HTCC2649]